MVEVLVVVSILGLLSSVLMVALQNARMRARDSKRIADLSQISKGLELYYSKHDSYPTLTVPLSECDYVEYPCNAEVDANWQGLISLLRKEGILAEQDWAPETKKQTLLGSIFPQVFAQTAELRVQDPAYPSKRYAYMVSAIPLYQSYRLRAQLENLSHQALRNSLRGKFLFSDEDDTTHPQNSCSPSVGLYCIGPGSFDAFDPGKPVVYLYPTHKQDVSVKIYPKNIEESVPPYEQGWLVSAEPSGQLFNYSDGKNYPYLFWEGQSERPNINKQEGFVVESSEVEKFLVESLTRLGLLEKEYNEFIEYWAPKMKNKKYVYIHFLPQAKYDQLVPMHIEPKPDTVIRIYMMFRQLDEFMEVKPQVLTSVPRQGFTVVEWGGDRRQVK